MHDPSANPTLLPGFVDDAHRDFSVSVLGECDGWHVHVHRIDAGMPIENGWVKDFPHSHHDDSITIVTFLTEPESGGEFAYICNGVTHVVPPMIGMSALCNGRTYHGPLPVYGDIPRFALLTTGFKWDS